MLDMTQQTEDSLAISAAFKELVKKVTKDFETPLTRENTSVEVIKIANSLEKLREFERRYNLEAELKEAMEIAARAIILVAQIDTLLYRKKINSPKK